MFTESETTVRKKEEQKERGSTLRFPLPFFDKEEEDSDFDLS